jgi:hypothetical protein
MSVPARAQEGAWGKIANPAYKGRPPVTALFFAGPVPSTALYTRHPKNASKLDWTNDADIDFALGQMNAVGLNTIKLSYWGHEGETDSWSPAWLFSQKRWPGASGSGNYTEAEQVALARHFFQKAGERRLMVGPMLEVSPKFQFWAEFPDSLDNMVGRASWLLKHFGGEPNWLRMFDRQGQPRYVIWLIESIHVGFVDPDVFAEGFEEAARQIEQNTGRKVGFILDPTPLPPYGSHAGPDPASLKSRDSVLAINPFNITSQGITYKAKQSDITETERLQYAESILKKWSASGIPFIAPILPGYDAHIVFPDLGKYGFNAAWRQKQKDLAARYSTDGLSIDCWNGWTEGYAIPPSVENGDVHMTWAADVIRAVRVKQEGLGDVNGDAQVDVGDAVKALSFIVGLDTATEAQNQRADMDSSGGVDVSDAIGILQYVVGG